LNSIIFPILIFLPSLAFAFVVLAAVYDKRKAYLALAWVPLTFFLLIRLFDRLMVFQRTASRWPETLPEVVAWISLMQFLFGLGLVFRAYRRKQNSFALLVASVLTVIPFVWWKLG
jgi:hypothetical protein